MIPYLALAGLAWASIKVNSPYQLREQYSKGIPSSLGNFGNPPYGSSIIGSLWYDSTIDGCSPFSLDSNYEETNPLIVMFDRGDCAFVLKVKHAQDVGARAVLISDNIPGQDISKIIMKDNGLGGNLYIPAMLISYEDGEKLKEFVSEPGVSLSIGFDIPKSKESIKISLVLTSFGYESLELMKLFKELENKLNAKNTNLEAHYVIIECFSCKKEGYLKEHDDCLGGGRYCAPDPDGIVGKLTGRMVVEEDLRQLCVLQHVKSEKSNYKLFFEYVTGFGDTCFGKNFDRSCAESVMKDKGINVDTVNKCIDNSFTGAKSYALQNNSKLQEEVAYWKNYGMGPYPAVFINDQPFRGDLEESAVVTAICAAYFSDTKPEFCSEEEDEEKSEKGIETSTVVIGLIVFFGILVALLLVYRVYAKKELQRDMRAQVNSAVNQYFALSDTSGFKNKQMRRLDH
jgi:hypothetical protein